MSSLAFSASPIDFQKNEKVANKINNKVQNKLSMEFLKKMVNNDKENETNELKNSISDIQSIHNNLEKDLKAKMSKTLGDFYESEMGERHQKTNGQGEIISRFVS